MPLTRIVSRGITDGTIASADLATGVGGKVLQVVTATDATSRSTSSTSFVTASNTLSVSITPSSTANKIFIIASTVLSSNSSDGGPQLTIYRNSTNLAGTAGFSGNYFTSAYLYTPTTASYLDSPSTTSSITYQVYVKAGIGTLTLNNLAYGGSGTATITAFEIAG